MYRFLFLFLFLGISNVSFGQYPDGTLVFSNSRGLVGRVAKRITGGDQYTHVGVVLDGKVYESDFPRAKNTPVGRYSRITNTNDYYVPSTPYSQQEVTRIKSYVDSHMGQSYRLRNYFHPNSRQVNGTWCSPFVGNALNASGRYNLSRSQIHEPQNLINAIGSHHNFIKRVSR